MEVRGVSDCAKAGVESVACEDWVWFQQLGKEGVFPWGRSTEERVLP